MRLSKKTLITLSLIFILLFAGVSIQLPFYIYKPGLADSLTDMVEVENGSKAKGSLHLVTVSGAQATPFEYILAKVLPYHEIVPLEEARPEGMTDEQYMQHQLFLMENSQHASMVVAYEAADKKVEIISNGVYVMQVVEEMPAEGIVEAGDRIQAVDGNKIASADDLVNYVQKKKPGDSVKLSFKRDGKKKEEAVEVQAFEEDPDKVGIGIQLVTDEDIKMDPEVHIKSGNIGGPSAGLMFALEMYNQLTEKDVTKGYDIAGTGEIDYDGNVHPIGGIDKKIVAADKEGVSIFFAPNENGKEHSNFEVAKATAEAINSDMKVVPIDSFTEALDYLEGLSPASAGLFSPGVPERAAITAALGATD